MRPLSKDPMSSPRLHTATPVMFHGRQSFDCVVCANRTDVIVAKESTRTHNVLAVCPAPSIHSVGTTTFHAAGNPINQPSPSCCCRFENHNAEKTRSIESVRLPENPWGIISNRHKNTPGTTTHVKKSTTKSRMYPSKVVLESSLTMRRAMGPSTPSMSWATRSHKIATPALPSSTATRAAMPARAPDAVKPCRTRVQSWWLLVFLAMLQ